MRDQHYNLSPKPTDVDPAVMNRKLKREQRRERKLRDKRRDH